MMTACIGCVEETCMECAPHAGIADNANRHAGGEAREPARQAGRQMSVAIKEEVRRVDCESQSATEGPPGKPLHTIACSTRVGPRQQIAQRTEH